MKRIIVIGATGTGKTTLASQLAQNLSLRHIDLDELHWLPEWRPRTQDSFRELVGVAVAADAFAVSGNYRAVRDLVWARADTVIWLNYPFWFVFFRLVRRSVLRIIDRKPICNGNIETWGRFLSRDSIVVWLFQTFWKRKKEIREIIDNPSSYPHITFLEFTSIKETASWLQTLSSPPSPCAP